jgi:hypothetical protein
VQRGKGGDGDGERQWRSSGGVGGARWWRGHCRRAGWQISGDGGGGIRLEFRLLGGSGGKRALTIEASRGGGGSTVGGGMAVWLGPAHTVISSSS